MNTQQILDLALSMAGLSEVPADSGILVPCDNVKRVMFGVDIETADLLLARELGVDLVIAHHPGTGPQAVNGYKVLEYQYKSMVSVGIPINKAQKAIEQGMDTRDKNRHSRNWDKVAAAARLLKLPLMNIHIPLDIITENTVQAHVDSRLTPKSRLRDLIAALREMPEFAGEAAGPVIRYGSPDSFAGKVLIRMAGGTGSSQIGIRSYFEAGAGTLVMMHIPEDSLQAARDLGYGNIVIAGHMRSDSVGINLFIEELVKKGIEVLPMGGIVSPRNPA